MITREKRNLNGSVQRIESNFAVYEIIDGNPSETRHQSAGYSIYDPAGKLIEEVCPNRLLMEDVYKDIYIYDARGRLIEREEYDPEGLLMGKTVFDPIDDNHRLEKHYYIDKQGILKLGSHTIYDSEDEAIETAHYDENGNVVPRHVYKFASPRKIRKNTLPDGDGYAVEESRHDKNDNLIDRTVTVYDSKGNRKEFSCYKRDGTLTLKDEFELEFDSNGNWIKQIQYHWVIGWGEFRLIPLTVMRRKIDYY
jgi:hypothetical protein